MTNKLILGTVQFGLDYGINNSKGKPSLDTVFKILNKAWDNGIRILDTAEAYGTSQEVIGKYHKEFPKRKFKIISKLLPNSTIKPEELKSHLKSNLDLLKIDNFYGYMFHSFDSYSNNIELQNELVLAKAEGLIEKLGVSLHSNTQLKEVLQNDNFKLIQLPFNLFDNHSKRGELLIEAQNKGVEIHTRSVFLQGLFFKNHDNILSNLSGFIPFLEQINKIKLSHNLSTETLCLQYALQKPYINQVLIGVDNEAQLISNIKYAKQKIELPNKVIDAINIENQLLLNPANWN
jgi:aryl-alcohol dehydrogenase-like predicted oxidoreductase